MICVHSKMCWVIKKNHVRKAITTNKVNQTAFKQLKKEKVIIKVKPKSLTVAYSTLKKQIQGIVL